MPITKSAKKALRGSEKKKVVNLRRKKKVDTAVKDVKKLTSKTDAQKTLSIAYKEIDKAAKNGLIKKGAAARKKSRLSKMVKKLA